MKRTLLVAMVTLLVFTSTTFISGANPENTAKEEVVYGLLDSSGTLESISVVNGFYLDKKGAIADYGDYTSVENLSSDEEITQSGGFLSYSAKSGRSYYRGNLSNRQLPWTIQIKYYLNGEQIQPEKLYGKSGKLKIKIITSQNKNESGTFFNDFALQITVPMDMDLCKNVSTTGATIADVGSSRQYSYVVLPGKDGSIQLSSTVSDFQMEAITLAGIRMNFDLDIDIDDFENGISQLVSAAAKLDDGALGLLKGAKALQSGMEAYQTGFSQLMDHVDQLQSGASSLESGISDLNAGLSSLSDQGATLRSGAAAIQQSVFDSANTQLAGTGLPTLTPTNYSSILGDNPLFADLKTQLDQITAFVAGVDSYTQGITQLSTGATDLSQGATQLTHGISTLAEGLNTLYENSSKLNDGMKTFLEGVASYQSGTKTFQQKTSTMEQEVNGQLDSMLSLLSDDGKVYQSFVSKENTNVNFVQFIIKTEEISKKDTTTPTEPTTEKKSIWEKFLDLFR